MKFTKQDIEAAKLVKRSDETTNLNGLHRGIVENIDDPDCLGRVQVRVWRVHGNDTQIPTYALPWAEVAEHCGGGYDYGPYNPPPVGSGVWCGFEDGNKDFPVVVGTSRGAPLRNETNPNIFLTKNGLPKVETPWLPPDGELETPKEIFEDTNTSDPHPTRRVWHKSYKGHTIFIEDGDGMEFLRIVDRAGQTIEMFCPVDEEKQAGNAVQRGTRNSVRGDQLPHEVMKYRRASIRLVDLSGQEVRLDAAELNEGVYITSRCLQSGSTQYVHLKSGPGKEQIEICDASGSKLRLDPNSNISILLEDSAGSAVYFDKQSGQIKFRSAKGQVEELVQKTVKISGGLIEEVGGDKEVQIGGNLKVNSAGDLSAGVFGAANVTIAGGLSLLVNNQPPRVLGSAIEISVAPVGGMKLNILAGDLILRTEAAGTVTLEAQGIGDVLVRSAIGTARVDGGTVKFGGIGANEPFVLGLQFQLLMGNILTLIEAVLTELALHTHGSAAGPTLVPVDAAAFGVLKGTATTIKSTVTSGNQLSNFILGQKLRTP